MSPLELSSLIVWGILYLLAGFAMHAVVERIIFHVTHQPVHPLQLRHTLRHWQEQRQIGGSSVEYHLGWLGSLVYKSQLSENSIEQLWQLTVRQRDSVLRFQNVLPTVANVATATGLLAGVLALVHSAGSEGVSAIGLGMHGTMVGLLIAIPVTLFLGLTYGRTDKLATQTEDVIDVLEQLLRETPPTTRSSDNNPATGKTIPMAPVAPQQPPVAKEPAKPERKRTRAKPTGAVSPVPGHIPLAPHEPPISMATQRGDRLVDRSHDDQTEEGDTP